MVNQYADDETNSGNSSINLPVYKTLAVGGTPTNVCSTSEHTDYNKLGVYQFLRLSITQRGNYAVRVERSGGDFVTQSDPDFVIYSRGAVVAEGASTTNNVELQTVTLETGDHIVEVADYENVNRSSDVTTCFNVFIARQ